MGTLSFGLILIAAGTIVWVLRRQQAEPEQRVLFGAGGILMAIVGVVTVMWSTAIYVNDNQGGVVVVKFGADLPAGQIIATEGEKGPQAEVLPPGWHFFFWPWIYDLNAVNQVDIPQGQIGVITARDGKQLPGNTVYAPEWTNQRMLDAQYFLSEGNGYRGPQLTVLSPGQYRYNPRQFEITLERVLEVQVGQVAVIKANAGGDYLPPDGEEAITVNGAPIVPKGYRGIWSEALTPNAYYMHPSAYVVTPVATTNRVYEYAGKDAIAVRTKDGFEFPVDVRVSVKISAQDAPYVVAKLASPDAKDGQFTVLEERVILPLVRAIFRNTAEDKGALEFVNQRSDIERIATERLEIGLQEFKVETDGVFIADIRIGETKAGLKLLATQTDREVALQEQETFREKERAQMARSAAVRAEEEANQQVEQAQARSRVIVSQEDAKGMVARAQGEAEAYEKKMKALGGVDNFVKLELVRMLSERWDGNLPRIFTGGGGDGGSPMDALVGAMLNRMQNEAAK
jgi:regulator of protease activity HflC (stomatin/prohibitin superfamily)